jgi:GH18 family chitinase
MSRFVGAIGARHERNFSSPEQGPLNVNAAVNSYLGAGVPPAKIVMGVRFVGTGWHGVGPTNNGLYQTATGPAPGTWDLPGAAPSGSFGFPDIEEFREHSSKVANSRTSTAATC